MAQILRMPAVAANADRAVLSSWSINENASFTAEDTLAEVETEKATVDIEAESDGVLIKRLVPAGAEVQVGAPIAVWASPGDLPGDISVVLRELGIDTDRPTHPADDGVGADRAHPASLQVEALPVADHGRTNLADPVPGNQPLGVKGSPRFDGQGTRVFASPLARIMAKDARLSLGDLVGSGPGGRIRRADVMTAIAEQGNGHILVDGQHDGVDRPKPAPPTSSATAGSVVDPPPMLTAIPELPAQGAIVGQAWVDEPHTRLRAVIANRLTESKNTIPHFYLRAALRVDRLLALRAEVNALQETKISVNDLVIAAAARAHAALPEMNCIWTEFALRRFTTVDVSIAVASERGLVTPTLRAVESLSLTAISAQSKGLVGKANAGRLRPEELTGGSLTVTNLGMFGVEDFAAIINPPQSAILAVGAARQEPVVTDGALGVCTIMRVTLSVDHRAIDGALAARWLEKFTALVENPLRVLI
jgi:pyruvate dehydrogenase E2 component (dihydrolipoamide acetyltransferase)